MKTDILLITDTIESNLSISYFDLIGVADFFMQRDITPSMIISSSQKIIPQIPKDNDLKIKFENILSPDFNLPNPPLLSEIVYKKYKGKVKNKTLKYICLPHTMRSCQVAATLSTKFNGSLIPGVDKIEKHGDKLLFKRSVMNGKWIAGLEPKKFPVIFTVNQGTFTNCDLSYKNIEKKKVVYEDIRDCSKGYRSLNLKSSDEGNSSIEDAEVVIGAGRGAENEKTIELIHDFAKLFKNSAVGASRPLCDSGVLPYSCQVGETGKQIAPKIYIACGISGSSQHVAGIRQAQSIIAINKDSQAAVYQIADIGIVEEVEFFLQFLFETIGNS